MLARGGKFNFEFSIPTGYPHDAPKVLCATKVRVTAGTLGVHVIPENMEQCYGVVVYKAGYLHASLTCPGNA
jgi:ubiquitin-protein ligase